MKLSNRLELVISLVGPTGSAADIGTDHGHVPVELVRRGIVKEALAMDVRKGPLGKAEENVKAAGLSGKITLRLSDGLLKLAPGEADAVIIAGMGGELMVHILEQGRHMWDSVSQWILSPHSEIHRLRKFLAGNGFVINKEAMVFEEGKYYTVLDVRREAFIGAGAEPEISAEYATDESVYRYGTYLRETKNPVFAAYLKDEEEKLLSLAENLKKQAEISERAKDSLKEVLEKLSCNREVQHEMQGID